MMKVRRVVRGRSSAFGLVLSASLAACTQVPREAFDDYRAGTREVVGATDKVLDDFQAAYATAAGLGYADEKLAVPSPGEGRIVDRNGSNDAERTGVAPNAIRIGERGLWEPPQDEAESPAERIIATRRRALNVVERYNEALLALAEGTSAAEFKTEATGLVKALREFPWGQLSESAAKSIASIAPGGSAVAEVLIQAIEQAQRERDRRKFIAAVEKGAPLIQGMIELLIADTANYRNIRYALIERDYTRHASHARTRARSMFLLIANAPAAAPDLGLSGQEAERLARSAARSVERGDAAVRRFPELADGIGLTRLPMTEPDRLIADAGELESLAQAIESDVASARALELTLTRYDEMLEKYVRLLRTWSGKLRALADAAANAEKSPPDTADLVALATSVRAAINVFEKAR